MSHVKIIAEVWPAADFKAKLDSGDINGAVLFGTNGEDGLTINTDYDKLRKSVDDDKTRRILKTRSAQEDRVPGVEDPLVVLLARAAEEGLNYDLFVDKPCSVDDGVYTYLVDATDWGSSALPSAAVRLSEELWQKASPAG